MFCITCGLPRPVRARLCPSCGTQFAGQTTASGVHVDEHGAACAPSSHSFADIATTPKVAAAARSQQEAAADRPRGEAAKKPKEGAAERPSDGAHDNALGLLKAACARLPSKPARAKRPLTVPIGQRGLFNCGVTKNYVTTASKLIPVDKQLLGPPPKNYNCDRRNGPGANYCLAYLPHIHKNQRRTTNILTRC